MVRCEDPRGSDKHLRFGHYTEELTTSLIAFPGVKAIVLHTHGTKGEHPHLHVWWSADAVTNQTIRNRLKAYDDRFKLMNSQNDWSFRNHEDYDAWAAYVQRNKTHKVLYGVLPAPVPEPIQLVAPSPVTPFIPAPTPRIKKLTAEERLINYCIREEGLQHNQWGLAHYEIIENKQKIHDTVSDILGAYAHGRLTNQQAIYMGRNVIWTFADPDLKAHLNREFTKDARKFW